MRVYTEYWAATMLRGFLAIFAGTAVMFIPEIAYTTWVLPFTVVTLILCLAAYGTIDSAIVFTMAETIPRGRPGKHALQLQGILGVAIGIFLFSLVYHPVHLHWFLYLAAIQAAGAAAAEFSVARGTSIHHGARWCFAAGAVAATSAVVLFFGVGLGPREVAWLLYAYLGLFGLTLLALSSRMLFAERAELRTALSES